MGRGDPARRRRRGRRTALACLAKETAKKSAFARGEIPIGIAADELRGRGYRFI
jgi:hypothetical protein